LEGKLTRGTGEAWKGKVRGGGLPAAGDVGKGHNEKVGKKRS